MRWKPVENDSVHESTQGFPAHAYVKSLRIGLTVVGFVASCGAAASSEVAGWPRLLEAAPAPFSVASDALARSGAIESTVPHGADGAALTESMLQWTEHALRLVQKHLQNPQRAVRSLALLHAVMHDAFVVAAREDTGTAGGAVAAHRAASLMLAYLYPYEPENWIEGKGLLLAYGWGRALGAGDAAMRRALAIGERVAADGMARAVADGADRRNPMARPPDSGPGRWRATPPINVHTPQEALAGEWRPWSAASLEVRAPPPPEYGSERFWRDAEEV